MADLLSLLGVSNSALDPAAAIGTLGLAPSSADYARAGNASGSAVGPAAGVVGIQWHPRPPVAAASGVSLPMPMHMNMTLPMSLPAPVGSLGLTHRLPVDPYQLGADSDASAVRRSKAAVTMSLPASVSGTTRAAAEAADDALQDDLDATAAAGSSHRAAVWTAADDELIEQLRAVHGNAWKTIAAAMPGR